jgi:hypothetical protein
VIPHHAHIIIGLRDGVDPKWWHKAMGESVSSPSPWTEEDSDYSNPEVAQPECLAPARLDQPGATAQADGDKGYVLKGRNAFIRVVPRAESTLYGDDNCYAVTYVHGEREITIWESYVFDFPNQWKSDMEIRIRVINECLGFSGEFAYRHMDGSEIATGSELPHRSRILIVPTPDPEPVQPECLAPARLVQPGATAQVCDGEDAHQVSDMLLGKPTSCTASEGLRSELLALRRAVPDTRPAIISFEKQSVQMLFSPDHAFEDFSRKVKELWNIPVKSYYPLVNGRRENVFSGKWPACTSVRVCIKGLLGGGKKGMLTVSFEGEECRCWTTQSFRKVAEDRGLEIVGPSIIDEATGRQIDIKEKVGDYFPAVSIGRVYWDSSIKKEEVIEESATFMIGNVKCQCQLGQSFKQAMERDGVEVECNMIIDIVRLWSFDIEELF